MHKPLVYYNTEPLLQAVPLFKNHEKKKKNSYEYFRDISTIVNVNGPRTLSALKQQ